MAVSQIGNFILSLRAACDASFRCRVISAGNFPGFPPSQKTTVCCSEYGMTRHHQWLQDLERVDALAILTDSDLLSHEDGHALFYDGLEALQNQCIIISADPEYFLENLKHVNSPQRTEIDKLGSPNS